MIRLEKKNCNTLTENLQTEKQINTNILQVKKHYLLIKLE